ncbi:unnamed protein product [Peniophora sp. CBMAI 1063]|nr:unnamed protein product [Peniophora sp. CBMAI 1063]
MVAADPTYPLFPIASFLASAMLSMVLLTSFVHQRWNLGVAFLCFWLFLENLLGGVSAIIWSDNADVKLYVYCDIVSRLELVTLVVKPMCTLIITRRLYLIVNLRSENAFSVRRNRKDVAIEWTLGLVIPLLLAGPLYYINEDARFQILEGGGCDAAVSGESVLALLLSTIWSFAPALLSVIIYYPRIAWILYTRYKDTSHFLQSSQSISRAYFFRLLMLASIDVLVTLPFGITTFVLSLLSQFEQVGKHITFYEGWDTIHSDWTPAGVTYAEFRAAGPATIAEMYFSRWSSPFLAFVIFALFGVTGAARGTYWELLRTAMRCLGWKPRVLQQESSALDTMAFGSRPQETIRDVESGSSEHPSSSDIEVSGVNSDTKSDTRNEVRIEDKPTLHES